MGRRSLAVVAALAASAVAQTTLTSCGGIIKWSSLTITPANPQAGDTAVVNGTGVVRVG